MHEQETSPAGDAWHTSWQSIYGELRRIAAGLVRHERPDHTLPATAVVHEAYLRLAGSEALDGATDRAHLLSTAVRVMRRVLVDHARRRAACKRGGAWQRVTLVTDLPMGSEPAARWLHLDDALLRLAAHDPVAAHLVELRVFGGVSLDDAAPILGVSRRTLVRRWRRTKAWLQVELGPMGCGAAGSDQAGAASAVAGRICR